MIKIMRCRIIFVFLLFSCFTNAQKKVHIPIIGERGETLITVDSLAFKDSLVSSLFYIDSIKMLPYTGKAVALYGIYSIDSLNIKNGYLDDLCKGYRIVGSKLILNRLEYYDRINKIIVSRTIYEKPKNGSSSIRFYDSGMNYYYGIQYKPKVIIVKLIISENGQIKEKKKLKFNTYVELSEYLKDLKVYKMCEYLNLFKETI
jgi:hypothetical protein